MKKLIIVLAVLLAVVLGMTCASADDADIFISDWANTENGLRKIFSLRPGTFMCTN